MEVKVYLYELNVNKNDIWQFYQAKDALRHIDLLVENGTPFTFTRKIVVISDNYKDVMCYDIVEE